MQIVGCMRFRARLGGAELCCLRFAGLLPHVPIEVVSALAHAAERARGKGGEGGEYREGRAT